MKEEQKKLRQANKKLIKNNDASDESLKQAISAKKRKLESVLSEEQQRVLKFVVEDGKRVLHGICRYSTVLDASI
jgi:transposase